LYLRVKKDLLRKIETGELKEGDCLPSEKDLCRFYKVSQITVRRAVGELTHENILVRQQGKGTFIRRHETCAQVKTILALVPRAENTFFYDEFYGPVWKGMEEEANISGCNLVFSSHSSDLKHKRYLLKAINSEMHSGIIVINELDHQLLYELRDKLPVVLVDYSLTDFFSVVSDNEGGAFEATGHLVSLGHRKIACLTVPAFGNSYPLRVSGYRKALEAFSIKNDFVFRQEITDPEDKGINAMEKLGHGACRKMLKNRQGITAIFAVSDAVAIGAMEALREEKIKVPEEMSIVGFDGIYDTIHSDPPLTTMDVPKEKMGRISVKTLLDNINNRNANPKEIILSPRLVIRASAAPPEKVV